MKLFIFNTQWINIPDQSRITLHISKVVIIHILNQSIVWVIHWSWSRCVKEMYLLYYKSKYLIIIGQPYSKNHISIYHSVLVVERKWLEAPQLFNIYTNLVPSSLFIKHAYIHHKSIKSGVTFHDFISVAWIMMMFYVVLTY